ncbi:MAG: DNA mismatch repair protein MutL [Gammaproteobacteria bacterium RIFCSPHIGHO2_12_FULL_41_15]|nr:MAG: DNA mismatch repair protein MutL [Gammaproteobacteria bacterium RIFCSPHIGHO2_12_FULL_41_15]
MNKIQRLDTLLANQIAAGEVVERPASVIKELIENSIDAGSQNITIHIKQGGHELIQVRDDGCGISKEDVVLALSRHATSKISSLSDLEAVRSLGFRGEALASIAAVSRLTLQTKAVGAEIGTEVKAQDNQIEVLPKPVGHPQGTTISVNDIFYNTPARRKFLRGVKTEFNYIATVVRRLALSRFDIDFSLFHNDKQEFVCRKAASDSAKEQRVATILGHEFMANALSIEFEAAGMRLWGWIALPHFTRSQSDMQHTYINGRIIRDKLMTHAMQQAYQDVLFHGRKPAYCIYLNIDPKIVDVNVHPTKHEVRFRNSQLVHQFLFKAVQDALSQVRPADRVAAKVSERVLASENLSESTATTNKNFNAHAKTPTKNINFNPNSQTPTTIDAQYRCTQPVQTEMAVGAAQAVYKDLMSCQQLSMETMTTQMLESEAVEPMVKHALGYAVAQLHDRYIVSQNDLGMVMVDMHAAHERILYERYKKDYQLDHIPKQQLLLPINVNLSAEEVQCIEQHEGLFQQIGLTIDWAGPNEVVLREIPILLKNADMAQLIHDVLADLSTYQNSQRVEEAINQVLGTLACRSAFRNPHKLTLPEMNALLRDIEKTNNSGFCNHGRPTWVQLNFKELDKFFLRGQ